MFHLCVVWLTMFITKTFILFRMELKAKTKWFFVIWSMVTRGDHSDEVTSVVFLVAKPRQLPWWVPGGTRKKAIERCQLRNGWCTNGDTRQETDIQIVHLLQHQILRMLTTHEQQNFHWQSSNINKNHWRMLKHNPFVSCNINNTKEINDIVKASCVKIMPLTRSVECEWLNKSPLPTNVSDTVNAPLPYTLDIDDSGGNNSCSLSDVAECSIILDKNTPPSEFLPDYNTVYTSVDTRVFSKSHPLPLIIEHKHPFGLKNPKFQCFFNSVLQLIFSIFRNNSYTSPFNSSTEGTLLKCLLQTAHNACNSKDVDALKFQLVRRDIFYNGQIQQDSTECLLMLINIIDKGSMPDSSSTTCPMGASLSDLLFSFVLEKYIVCEVCGLRSPSFESSSVLHISPTDTPSMQNLILEGLQQKLQKSCSRCNKNTRHIESGYILQPPKYLLLFVNRFRYLNNNIIKDRCPIPLDATVMLGPLKFNLQATIDHHGPSIDSGHYTASINCCKKNILLQRSQNYGVRNYW